MVQVLLFAGFVSALLLTIAVERYARHRQLLDIPNARSSHTRPTPRGGGLAIVVAFAAGALGLWADGGLPFDMLMALSGGLLVAAIGFVDDRGHVPARWRLLAHFLAAAWALVWLGGVPELPLGEGTLALGPAGYVLGALGIVWLLNLYNFMDGIDGIAGVEAVTVAGGAALLQWLSGGDGVAEALLMVGAAGFLVWNWPPAKIFMGDVGSGFLGFVLAVLALGSEGAVNVWCWLILLAVFWVDASYTLLRRLLRGERVYEAHRSHAYQRAARRFGGHRPVTLAVAAVNLLWLWPLAWLAVRSPGQGPWLLALAAVPLLAAAVWLGAGRPESAGETPLAGEAGRGPDVPGR